MATDRSKILEARAEKEQQENFVTILFLFLWNCIEFVPHDPIHTRDQRHSWCSKPWDGVRIFSSQVREKAKTGVLVCPRAVLHVFEVIAKVWLNMRSAKLMEWIHTKYGPRPHTEPTQKFNKENSVVLSCWWSPTGNSVIRRSYSPTCDRSTSWWQWPWNTPMRFSQMSTLQYGLEWGGGNLGKKNLLIWCGLAHTQVMRSIPLGRQALAQSWKDGTLEFLNSWKINRSQRWTSRHPASTPFFPSRERVYHPLDPWFLATGRIFPWIQHPHLSRTGKNWYRLILSRSALRLLRSCRCAALSTPQCFCRRLISGTGRSGNK